MHYCMKKHLLILFLLISSFLQSQENTSVADFLPPIYLTKQRLLDKFAFQKELNYSFYLDALTNRTDRNPPLIWKEIYRDSIIYAEIWNNMLDTIINQLNFNSKKQLISWDINLSDCYNRYDSDVPSPMLSNYIFKYNNSDNIEHIEGYCATKAYSTKRNFYYNTNRDLDSIVYKAGYSDLKVQERIIFIDSALFSSETNGSTVLILNTTLDYSDWIRREFGEDIPIDVVNSIDPFYTRNISRNTHTVKRESGVNYMYEFDSLGRTIHLRSTDVNGNLCPMESMGSTINYCAKEDNSPALIEIYYEKDKISFIDHYTCNYNFSESKFSSGGRMKILWRKDNLREIQFYKCYRMVDSWSPRHGLAKVHLTHPMKERKAKKLIERLERNKLIVAKELSAFPPDTVLLYSDYKDMYWNPNPENPYLIQKIFSTYVLSDTVNSVIRYIWIQGDAITDIIYVKNGEIISSSHLSSAVITTFYPIGKKEYMLTQESDTGRYYGGGDLIQIPNEKLYFYKNSMIPSNNDWESEAAIECNTYGSYLHFLNSDHYKFSYTKLDELLDYIERFAL